MNMSIQLGMRICGVMAGFLWLLTETTAQADVIQLSDGNAIVNIDARLHGCANYSGPNPPQPYWFGPSANSPALHLTAGTYSFRLVNPTDATALYPELTPSQASSIFTAWTFNSPWVVNYMVFDEAAVTNLSLTQLFDGGQDPASPGSSVVNANSAYNYAISSGYYEKIRPAPPGRSGGPETFLTSFTLLSDTTLRFVIPDTILGDNGGGVSVLVTRAVPEPSVAGLLGIGITMLVLNRRRRVKSPS